MGTADLMNLIEDPCSENKSFLPPGVIQGCNGYAPGGGCVNKGIIPRTNAGMCNKTRGIVGTDKKYKVTLF